MHPCGLGSTEGDFAKGSLVRRCRLVVGLDIEVFKQCTCHNTMRNLEEEKLATFLAILLLGWLALRKIGP